MSPTKNKPMKVFSFVKVDTFTELDGTQYYRQVQPLDRVRARAENIEVTLLTMGQMNAITKKKGSLALEEVMSGYDVYAYPRMIHEDCQEFLDKIHSWGGKLVIDADDDLTEDFRLVSGHGHHFRQVLEMVDRVTTSTQALADHLTQYTKEPPVTLLNCVDVKWMQDAMGRRFIKDPAIGFSGSPTHYGDWYLAAVPFKRICEDYPGVTPILHGEMPPYMRFLDSPVELGPVPYHEYPNTLGQFDILLCAVDASDKFNLGKSSVKALECMALGVVPICSQFKPYMDLKDQGAPVVIVEENGRDGWYEAIAGLLDDPDLQKHLSEQGPDWVSEHRDIKTHYKHWEKFYHGINEGKAVN